MTQADITITQAEITITQAKITITQAEITITQAEITWYFYMPGSLGPPFIASAFQCFARTCILDTPRAISW